MYFKLKVVLLYIIQLKGDLLGNRVHLVRNQPNFNDKSFSLESLQEMHPSLHHLRTKADQTSSVHPEFASPVPCTACTVSEESSQSVRDLPSTAAWQPEAREQGQRS